MTLSLSIIKDLMNSSLDIYPKELDNSETTESTLVALYLHLLLARDENNNITTKLYDKADVLSFHIVNFPFMSSNMPPALSMHPSSFAMPIVVQIIVTFYHATGSW